MKITIALHTENGSVVSASSNARDLVKAITILKGLWRQAVLLQGSGKVMLKGWEPTLTIAEAQIRLQREVNLRDNRDLMEMLPRLPEGTHVLPKMVEIYVGEFGVCEEIAQTLASSGLLVTVKPAEIPA